MNKGYIDLEEILETWKSITNRLEQVLTTRGVNYYMGSLSERPENARRGDEFLDTDNNREYVFDGSRWIPK